MPTKQDLLDSNSVAHQQALVEKLLSPGPRPVKRIIPGGKTLLQQVGKEQMAATVYNWLRGCTSFTEVKISLAKAAEVFTSKTTRVVSFDTRDGKLAWETGLEGRKTLAREIAKIMNSRPLLAVHVKPDGIYVTEDITKKFSPTVVVTEAMSKTDDYKDIPPGTKVPSPDWEPFIEFLPSKTAKSKYTQFERGTV